MPVYAKPVGKSDRQYNMLAKKELWIACLRFANWRWGYLI